MRLESRLQGWIDARQRFHLSDAHVQMALELGLNPNKLGKIGNHRQEPWKQPLPQFIEQLYLKRFGRARPERVGRIEERTFSGKKAATRARSAPREQAVRDPSRSWRSTDV